MVEKFRTDLSILSGVTGAIGAIVMPQRRIPRKKRIVKLLATSPPRKDLITDQDKIL